MSPLKIEQTPLEELVPYECNARTHSRTQIRQIAKSIQQLDSVIQQNASSSEEMA